MTNATLDALSAYAQQTPAAQRVGALVAPFPLRMMPMLMLSMLKNVSCLLLCSLFLPLRTTRSLGLDYLPAYTTPCPSSHFQVICVFLISFIPYSGCLNQLVSFYFFRIMWIDIEVLCLFQSGKIQGSYPQEGTYFTKTMRISHEAVNQMSNLLR